MSVSTLYICDCCGFSSTATGLFQPAPSYFTSPTGVNGAVLLCPDCRSSADAQAAYALSDRMNLNKGKTYGTA